MSFDLRINDGDLVIGTDGDFSQVQDTEKLIQDILKLLTTPIGTNVFFSWYGSPLTDVSIGNILDTQFTSTLVKQTINSNLETLQKLQSQQVGSGQRVTAGELLAAIQYITVNRNVADPTYWTIVVKILTKALKGADAILDVAL